MCHPEKFHIVSTLASTPASVWVAYVFCVCARLQGFNLDKRHYVPSWTCEKSNQTDPQQQQQNEEEEERERFRLSGRRRARTIHKSFTLNSRSCFMSNEKPLFYLFDQINYGECFVQILWCEVRAVRQSKHANKLSSFGVSDNFLFRFVYFFHCVRRVVLFCLRIFASRS